MSFAPEVFTRKGNSPRDHLSQIASVSVPRRISASDIYTCLLPVVEDERCPSTTVPGWLALTDVGGRPGSRRVAYDGVGHRV